MLEAEDAWSSLVIGFKEFLDKSMVENICNHKLNSYKDLVVKIIYI